VTSRRRALIDALGDPDPSVRGKATEALDRLDVWEGMPDILPRLRSFAKADWLKLLVSLVGRRDEITVKLGLRSLDHPDEEVRVAALELVAACADLRACPVVCRHLADHSPLVRGKSAEVLAQLGDRRRGDDVALLLDDEDPRVVARAASALGLLDHGASEPRLLALSSHQDPAVRAAAVEALGRIGKGAAGQ
jgi:HEAT repeat protein